MRPSTYDMNLYLKELNRCSLLSFLKRLITEVMFTTYRLKFLGQSAKFSTSHKIVFVMKV